VFEQLLSTKIQLPPLPPEIVARRRLHQSLDRGLQPNVRMTLISAPAGYGKTTLLVSWIRDRAFSAAWLSLNVGDDDPNRFMRYLLAALNAEGIGAGAKRRMEGPFPAAGYQTRVLTPIINQLDASSRQFVLALDDYHWIHNQSIHDCIAFLLENLPANAHIYIATRADPPLPIARLRGRGQVHEVRMQDLRFRSDETADFLNILSDLGLAADHIQTLQRRTEGWISGLQMAAATLRNQEDREAFIQDFSGTHHHIMEYLLDEVLRREPREMQMFLLETSILERLCASLCDAVRDVSGGNRTQSQALLRRLERENLFIVPLDGRRHWYRYHRLFSDLLQMRLQGSSPGSIPGLHRRASEWHKEHGIIQAAVHHALSCGDDQFAGDMVERYSQEMLLRSETVTFLGWVRALPHAQIRARPRLAIYRAWSLLLQGAPLSVVEAGIDDSRSGHGPPGSSQSLEAFILLCQGHLEGGRDLAEEALRLLPDDEIFLRDFATTCAAGARISLGEVSEGMRLLNQAAESTRLTGNRAATVLMLCELAELRMKQLELDAAEGLYQRALQIGTPEDASPLPISGRALIGLGGIALERFDLDSAERLLLEGIELASGWSLISALDGYLSLATLYDLRNADSPLQATLKTLHDLSRRFDASEFDDIIVMMLEARVNLRRGNLQAVRKWAEERGLARAPGQRPSQYGLQQMETKIYKYELPIIARWRIADGQYEEALDALTELVSLAEGSHRPFLLVEAEILRARIHDLLGNREAAVAALGRALAISAPERLRRLFLAENDDISRLLEAGRSEWADPQVCNLADDLIARMEKYKPSEEASPTNEVPEALTPRELDVLRLLPSGLSAQEIGDQLVISVNTVRSHMKSIYAKLSVHSRHEAVLLASQLDLL
jgi:LuxR family maltose regulon positive regulatory protein